MNGVVENVCVWIVSSRENQDFNGISRFFGIWHEHSRGAHGGIHEFYFRSNHVLLLNIQDASVDGVESYSFLKPPDVTPLANRNFY